MEVNNAKLREAMEAIEEIYNYAAKSMYKMMSEGVQICDWPQWLITKTSAVLALPRLNCEVYTLDEMARKHNDYCGNNRGSFYCINSPATECKKCFAKWEQMPYEEGDAK